MFNQDEGKIECAVGNREICVWQGKKAEIVFDLISDVGICGIYLSLALGTAKFKQLDKSCSLGGVLYSLLKQRRKKVGISGYNNAFSDQTNTYIKY